MTGIGTQADASDVLVVVWAEGDHLEMVMDTQRFTTEQCIKIATERATAFALLPHSAYVSDTVPAAGCESRSQFNREVRAHRCHVEAGPTTSYFVYYRCDAL
jgi:hypothetical protein